MKQLTELCMKKIPLGDFESPSDYPVSIAEIKSKDELLESLLNDNCSMRSGFKYKNLAFVQQINGGDEWLVLRQNTETNKWEDIESISFEMMHKNYADHKYAQINPHYAEQQIKSRIHKLADPEYAQNRVGIYTSDDCDESIGNYENQMVVVDSSYLKGNYQSKKYQLFTQLQGLAVAPPLRGKQ